MLAHASQPPTAPLIAPLPPFVRFHFLRSRQIELRLEDQRVRAVLGLGMVALGAPLYYLFHANRRFP